MANDPQPDGRFTRPLLGDVDFFDGQGPNFDPDWTLRANLPAEPNAYDGRVHPWMRGAFEVVP